MEVLENFYIGKYSNHINELSKDYPLYFNNLLINHKIPLNKNSKIKTIVAWSDIPIMYEFYYDFLDNEKQISEWLNNSPLSISNKLIVEFGYNLPIIEVDVGIFIQNWNDFIAASGFSGITCITDTYNLFLEFSDDSDFILRSNFPIKPV